MDASAMDTRDTRRRSAPPVLELLEPPRGMGLTIDELEEGILAIRDVADYASTDRRARLRRLEARLELELARLVATI